MAGKRERLGQRRAPKTNRRGETEGEPKYLEREVGGARREDSCEGCEARKTRPSRSILNNKKRGDGGGIVHSNKGEPEYLTRVQGLSGSMED